MDFLDIVNDYINKLPEGKTKEKLSVDVKDQLEDIPSTSIVEKKEPVHYSVSDIVEKINNGVTIQQIAEEIDFNVYQIRLLLKQNKYRYDLVLNWWTQLSRDELLDHIETQLESGQITLEDLKKQKVDIKYLASTLYTRKAKKEKETRSISQKEDVTDKNVTEETVIQNNTLLTKEEYETIQQIIQYWKVNVASVSTEEVLEERVNVHANLSRSNYEKLQALSGLLNISQEHIINQAIHQYLIKMNRELG